MKKSMGLYSNGLEKYPKNMIVIENTVLSVWVIMGAVILWRLNALAAVLYVGYAFIMILFIMRKLVCTHCYYFDKMCHMGWGKIAALFFKQGDINKFESCFGMKVAPVFFISLALFPLVFGTVSLVLSFSSLTLILLMIFVPIVAYSSIVLRKKSCNICKMKTICSGSAVK